MPSSCELGPPTSGRCAGALCQIGEGETIEVPPPAAADDPEVGYKLVATLTRSCPIALPTCPAWACALPCVDAASDRGLAYVSGARPGSGSVRRAAPSPSES